MGGCIRKNSVQVDVYQSPSLEEVLRDMSDEIDFSVEDSTSFNFHMYVYQKQMQQKERELLSWCRSKLILTENIIRINRSRLQDSLSSGDEAIQYEIEQLQEYRKKLMDLMKHLKKLNSSKKSHRRVRKMRSHKCAVKIIAALTEAISN